MSIEIRYESEDFPASSRVANGVNTLRFSWDDLLWSALTVGRPNRHYVFRHGDSSLYEALFRLSLIRMALEQSAIGGGRLRRTDAAQSLDPSEKGAVNYFLGLSVCKLFADCLLDIPWMLHLDVFRKSLDSKVVGASRPDLVGQDRSAKWFAFECKGRTAAPSTDTKTKMKRQATRLVSVNGVAPTLHVGGVSYFSRDELCFYWCDPEPSPDETSPIEIALSDDMAMELHYFAALGLVRSDPNKFSTMREAPALVGVEGADVKVGIHPEVLKAILQDDWGSVRQWRSSPQSSVDGHRYRSDGIAIVAGPSWRERYQEGVDQP